MNPLKVLMSVTPGAYCVMRREKKIKEKEAIHSGVSGGGNMGGWKGRVKGI